jgi:hypothetical protein
MITLAGAPIQVAALDAGPPTSSATSGTFATVSEDSITAGMAMPHDALGFVAAPSDAVAGRASGDEPASPRVVAALSGSTVDAGVQAGLIRCGSERPARAA